ncbi:MAG: enoyl-CoA hydratase/isomerase family protein, partial [Desulfomonilia bacterium]
MAHEDAPMNGSGVTVERIGHIALVVLNRPERKNALNEHMWDCMENVIDELKKNLPRVVVITGAGNEAFCAGFDVNPDNPQVSNLVGAVER